ncbi:DinB family protein [bacterium]|nr:MAG: DinB family protein [bacterium]
MESETRTFLVGLFREAYEGAWKGDGTYFVDNRPGAGLLDTLDRLSAEEASEVVLPGTSSIVGHVVHLAIGMAATRDELDGGSPDVDWEGTWKLQATDADGWALQRRELHDRYRDLLHRFDERPWEAPLMEALAYSTAHAAWHLGAIRQLMGTRVERQG